MRRRSGPQPTTARLVRRGRGTVARARRQRHAGGQAMIEFSFVMVLLLMGIFGTISAALWSVQSMAATSAEEGMVRVAAAAAPGTPNVPVGQNIGTLTTALNAAGSPYLIAKSSMFGTALTIQPWGSCAGANVATMSAAVYVCSQAINHTVNGLTTRSVQVWMVGCAATLIPHFGLSGCKSGVPINAFSEIQAQTFTQ